MKQITQEELAALRTGGGGNNSWLRDVLLSMKAGEIIQIDASEWRAKRSPAELTGRIRRAANGKRNFIVKRILDGSGWVIICEK